MYIVTMIITDPTDARELSVTEPAQKTGLCAMRRAITARRICVAGLMEAFVTNCA